MGAMTLISLSAAVVRSKLVTLRFVKGHCNFSANGDFDLFVPKLRVGPCSLSVGAFAHQTSFYAKQQLLYFVPRTCI